MARPQTPEEKLEACINMLLQKEFPYTHTSDVNDAAASGAAHVAEKIVARKRARKEGVRPLNFLDLPPEIRDQIYELAVKYCDSLTKDVIRLKPKRGKVDLDRCPALQPGITSVTPASNLNDFCVVGSYCDNASIENGDAQVCQWLDRIGEQNAQMLQSFRIFWYCPVSRSSVREFERIKAASKLAMVAKVTTCKTTQSFEQGYKWTSGDFD
ncbi:hypothetical protein LTR17_014823 [Elasticomyces elasticus]|nr:hypothetical protein LTR17_014823 [Elasticomyces elasticus]